MPYKDIEKQRAAQRKHYDKNKEKIIQESAWRRRANKQKLDELKSKTPCSDCKKFYPPYVTQYDHINGDKIADVSRLLRSRGWQQVLDEIAKCELVCANCHMTRTYERHHN